MKTSLSSRKTIIGASLALVMLAVGLVWGPQAWATTKAIHQEDEVVVQADAVHDGSLYATTSSVVINGRVDGDVYCAAQTVTIRGSVNGDVICAAQNINISGRVTGDIRVAGQNVMLEGATDRNVSVFAQTASLSRAAIVAGDLNGAVQTMMIDGSVGQNVMMAGSSLSISGKVGRDVNMAAEQLTIQSGAAIAGSLSYPEESRTSIATGVVKGQVTAWKDTRSDQNSSDESAGIGGWLLMFAGMLVVSILLIACLPAFVQDATRLSLGRVMLSIVVGFFAVVATPIVAIILLVTLVGIPLAGIILLLWLLVMAFSGSIAAYVLGRVLVGRYVQRPLWIMLLGLVALGLLYLIPVVNIITGLLALTVGSGLIILTVVERHKKAPPHTQKSAAKKVVA